MPLHQEVPIESVNEGLKYFPANTEKLVGSGIRYSFEEAGFYVDFPAEKRQAVFGFENKDFYLLVDPDTSYLPQLAQPSWVISGITLWGLCNLPVSKSFSIPRVKDREDGHQLTTELAIDSVGESLETYFGENLFALDDLPRQVSYQDVPDPETSKNANLTSLLHDNLGHPQEMLARHALRPLYVNSAAGTVTLASQNETLWGIRQNMDAQLNGLFAVNQKLLQRDTLKNFEPGDFQARLNDLTAITDALASENYGAVINGLLKFRQYAAYGQMRDFQISPEDRDFLMRNPKYLADMVRCYAALKVSMEKVQALASELSLDKDETKLADAVRTYGTVLRHFRPEFRAGLGFGEISFLAQRDLHLAHLLHLAQDSRAHCNEWELDRDGDGLGEVCTESVGVNLFGIGPLHAGDNDELEGADGELKLDRGVTISVEILSLARLNDKNQFETEKKNFLDKYWPTDFDVQETRIAQDVGSVSVAKRVTLR